MRLVFGQRRRRRVAAYYVYLRKGPASTGEKYLASTHMSRARIMNAGAVVRRANGGGGVSSAQDQGGGDSLIGLPGLTNRAVNGAMIHHIRTRADGGASRHWVFCMNQLGGVGGRWGQAAGPGNRGGVSAGCAQIAAESRRQHPIVPLKPEHHVHWVNDPEVGWTFYRSKSAGHRHDGIGNNGDHHLDQHEYIGQLINCNRLTDRQACSPCGSNSSTVTYAFVFKRAYFETLPPPPASTKCKARTSICQLIDWWNGGDGTHRGITDATVINRLNNLLKPERWEQAEAKASVTLTHTGIAEPSCVSGTGDPYLHN